MTPSSQPNHAFPAEAPSNPALTLVGLGPPPEYDEPVLAGFRAYLEDEPVLADADEPDDDVTLVANYDEITVVTKPSAPATPVAEPIDFLAALDPSATVAPQPDALEAPPPGVFTEASEMEALDPAVLVESEPELRLFAPPLESFAPPKRFSRAPLAIALGLVAFATALVALVWTPSTTQTPAVRGASEKVTLPNDQAATDARAQAVARALEAAVEKPPATEVVSVEDLRVKPEASRTQLASAPETPFVPVDLDREPAEPAGDRATLSLTSTPPCNVVLDGRPLGTTPRELEVAAGAHSVVFIHPQKGRKSLRVEALAGKAAVASVSF